MSNDVDMYCTVKMTHLITPLTPEIFSLIGILTVASAFGSRWAASGSHVAKAAIANATYNNTGNTFYFYSKPTLIFDVQPHLSRKKYTEKTLTLFIWSTVMRPIFQKDCSSFIIIWLAVSPLDSSTITTAWEESEKTHNMCKNSVNEKRSLRSIVMMTHFTMWWQCCHLLEETFGVFLGYIQKSDATNVVHIWAMYQHTVCTRI